MTAVPAAAKRAADRRYFFRLLALSGTTIFGIWFLGEACTLTYIYVQRGGHFPRLVTTQDFIETALHGLAFICSGFLYAILARKVKPTP